MNYSKKIEELNKLKNKIENSDDLDKTIDLYSEALKVYGELKNSLEKIETKLQELRDVNE